MTVIRTIKEEVRTVLDFSRGRHSKNKIKRLIRDLEIEAYKYNAENNTNTFIRNEIRVGIFTIELIVSIQFDQHRLKDFSGMVIDIREEKRENPYIKLHSHHLFKNQNWAVDMCMSGFKVNHLIEAIHYCVRLNNLKIFL